MPEDRRFRIGKARKGGIAVAAAAALAAAVYVSVGAGGNGADAAACAASLARAKGLDPLVGGEVAAFRVADQPALLADLAFKGPDGQDLSLAAFAGKVTLLNLWATWCAPCRQEMPALDRLQAALGGSGFAVVPVSIDTGGPERPRAFLESIGVKNLPLYADRSTAIFTTLKSRGMALGLPVTFLVDRDGCELGRMNGPAEWDSPEGRRLIEAALASAAPGL